MRIVIALGGNALLQRGQPMTAENQRANIRDGGRVHRRVTPGNEIVVAHGNGPQVGLLALQAAAYHDVAPYPLDVLGAQTEAMIGYVIEQELGNLLPANQPLATLLTMIEVDRDDPAFSHPTKPIGPVYDRETAERLKAASGWTIAPDGDKFRRVVASPKPKKIFEIQPIRSLVEQGTIVICAGGGGIPTMYDEERQVARRGGRHRQGPRVGAARRTTRRRPARHRHRRRRRLYRLGHAEPGAAGPGHPRCPRRSGSTGGVDGPESRGRMRLRAQYRQGSRYRLTHRHRRNR